MALKLFAPGAEAFQRELDMTRRIEALRAAQHAPHLIQSLGTGEVEGRGWIAFEYLGQGSLHDLVGERGPLAPGWAARYARDAARGLARLHEAGVFHRDVKPANLLLGSDDRVRLGDFGLSRDLSGELSAAGSPAFAAPEVIAGDVREGERADVYSLGATLSFLLTGETCYPGHPNVFAYEEAGVPGPLQELLVGAMALVPERRTPTARALLAQLEELELPSPAERHVAPSEGPWSQGAARRGRAASPAQALLSTRAGLDPAAPSPGAGGGGHSRARRRGLTALGAAALLAGWLGAGWLGWGWPGWGWPGWGWPGASSRGLPSQGGDAVPVELRVSEALPGLRVRLGEQDLGALSETRTLFLSPGAHQLEVEREGARATQVVEVVAGRQNVIPLQLRFPLQVEAPAGVQATVRGSDGAPVELSRGWILEDQPTPFEARLPLGRYRVSLAGPDHHPGQVELALAGPEQLRPALRPILRFAARCPEVVGFWALPEFLDVDGDGVLDVLANGFDARDGVLVALSGRDGRTLWRCAEQTNRWAQAALSPGGRLAIGALSPAEDPTFGLAEVVFLEPSTGAVEGRVPLGLSSRPPMTGTPFRLAGAQGLLFVTDCQLAPPWGPGTLSAVREDGLFLWQRRAKPGDGEPAGRHGLFGWTVDRDGDGAFESVVWEVEGEVLAFAPGAQGAVHWRYSEAVGRARRTRWSRGFERVLVTSTWDESGGVIVTGLDPRGERLWRRELRGQAVINSWWIPGPRRGRRLALSLLHAESSELVILDEGGEVLARRRFEARSAQRCTPWRGPGGGRYLAVQTALPARVVLLDLARYEPVWERELGPERATMACADLDGDGVDALVLLYRDGQLEVLDPPPLEDRQRPSGR